jgi:hypothetical protein
LPCQRCRCLRTHDAERAPKMGTDQLAHRLTGRARLGRDRLTGAPDLVSPVSGVTTKV